MGITRMGDVIAILRWENSAISWLINIPLSGHRLPLGMWDLYVVPTRARFRLGTSHTLNKLN